MTHTWIIRPGCFGSNIAFDGTSSVCVACVDSVDCAQERNRTRDAFLATLDKHHDAKGKSLKSYYVTTPRKRADKQAVALADVQMDNERAQKIYQTLASRGVDLQQLKQGVNPLANVKAPEFLRIATDCLSRGAIAHSELRHQLVDRLAISQTSAMIYLNIILSLLGSLNIIDPKKNTLEVIA